MINREKLKESDRKASRKTVRNMEKVKEGEIKGNKKRIRKTKRK